MRLKIGEFSKLGQVSVSALRYYDEVGLLRPVEVDRFTGYRYYAFDQLGMLHRLLAFKDLGLSLEQIRHLLGEELPAEQIKGMLRLKQAELQSQIGEIKEQLRRVEARIEQIEMEGKMPEYDVITRSIDPVRVAMLRQEVENMEVIGQTLNRAFDQLMSNIEAQGAQVGGPAVTLYYDDLMAKPDNFEVGAAVPVAGKMASTDRIQVTELPGVELAACVVHKGSFATLGGAYEVLHAWIEKNGYSYAGPGRELTLQYDRNGNPADWITEIQAPISK